MLDTINHIERIADIKSGVLIGTIERFIRPDYVHSSDPTIANDPEFSYGYLATTPQGVTHRWLASNVAITWLHHQAELRRLEEYTRAKAKADAKAKRKAKRNA